MDPDSFGPGSSVYACSLCAADTFASAFDDSSLAEAHLIRYHQKKPNSRGWVPGTDGALRPVRLIRASAEDIRDVQLVSCIPPIDGGEWSALSPDTQRWCCQAWRDEGAAEGPVKEIQSRRGSRVPSEVGSSYSDQPFEAMAGKGKQIQKSALQESVHKGEVICKENREGAFKIEAKEYVQCPVCVRDLGEAAKGFNYAKNLKVHMMLYHKLVLTASTLYVIGSQGWPVPKGCREADETKAATAGTKDSRRRKNDGIRSKVRREGSASSRAGPRGRKMSRGRNKEEPESSISRSRSGIRTPVPDDMDRVMKKSKADEGNDGEEEPKKGDNGQDGQEQEGNDGQKDGGQPQEGKGDNGKDGQTWEGNVDKMDNGQARMDRGDDGGDGRSQRRSNGKGDDGQLMDSVVDVRVMEKLPGGGYDVGLSPSVENFIKSVNEIMPGPSAIRCNAVKVMNPIIPDQQGKSGPSSALVREEREGAASGGDAATPGIRRCPPIRAHDDYDYMTGEENDESDEDVRASEYSEEESEPDTRRDKEVVKPSSKDQIEREGMETANGAKGGECSGGNTDKGEGSTEQGRGTAEETPGGSGGADPTLVIPVWAQRTLGRVAMVYGGHGDGDTTNVWGGPSTWALHQWLLARRPLSTASEMAALALIQFPQATPVAEELLAFQVMTLVEGYRMVMVDALGAVAGGEIVAFALGFARSG